MYLSNADRLGFVLSTSNERFSGVDSSTLLPLE